MNQLVLLGTQSSCYRGPESSLRACFPALSSSRSNFTACNEDASCIHTLTRKASLRYDSCRQCTRVNAIARKSARWPTSTSSPGARHILLQPLARRGELANIRGWHDGHHKPESGESAVRLTSAVRDGFTRHHEGAGKKSCDLTQIPVSSADAAPPWRKEKARVEAAGSRRPLHSRSDRPRLPAPNRNVVPSIQILCSSTASARATAVAARFRPFFLASRRPPSRSLNASECA